MKIALVTSEYPSIDGDGGGLGTYTSKVAGMLANEGHRVVICSLAGKPARFNDGAAAVIAVRRTKPIAPLRRTRFFWRYELPLRRYLDSRRLLQALHTLEKHETIDIVHLASYQTPGLATAASCRWPTITRFSSLEWLWREANGGQPDASERLLDRLESHQARSSTATCSPSAFLARKVKSSLGLTARIVRTPPPVTNLDGLDRPRREAATVAYVGSCNRAKGFDLFLEAIEGFLPVDPLVRVEIAGRTFGASPLLSQLNGVLGAFPDRVIYHGVVDQGSVSDIYRRAGCIVIPSRVDNYPNVCLEAQSHGCPVLASRDSSLDEMVTDGIEGLLFSNESSSSLQRALADFRGLHKTRRDDMSRAALQVSATRRKEVPIRHLVSLYDDARLSFHQSQQ